MNEIVYLAAGHATKAILKPTPLVICPKLAQRAGVMSVFVKDEGERSLGNFKVLGGMSAGLKALSRAVGVPVAQLRNYALDAALPTLICASDGNHGLAVAAGARLAGAPATIYLHQTVDAARIARIRAQGADIVIVDGTYDDAVAEALKAALRNEGLLIPDTSSDPDDPVVRDVMAGYATMTNEIKAQLRGKGAPPTHIFVQAGVGGLAATLGQELWPLLSGPRAVIVVEPNSAACVGHALTVGRIERIQGDLHTAAEMLSCGVASASAVEILKRLGARPLAVNETCLEDAVRILSHDASIESTPSGAAGLAGLLHAAASPELRNRYELHADSVVLLVSTERAISQQRN